jgi:DNA-binding MarR family transcriptional regulator
MSKELQVTDSAAPEGAIDAASDHASLSPSGASEHDGGAAANPENAAAVDLDPTEHRAWRAFLIAHARVARRLETDLMARSDLPLAEFDVLFQLDMADGQRLRMNELAERVVLSRAGITRLVDRLVADGLVARLKCADDARGSYAVLTELGRRRLDEAKPGHFAMVRRCFLAAFSQPELEGLAGLLERDFPIG